MRSATVLLACAGIALLGWVGGVHAQKSAPPPPSSPFSGGCNSLSNPACASLSLKQFDLYGDISSRLFERDHDAKKVNRDYARTESEKLIQALSLPCELEDAERAGGGRIRVDSRMLDVNVYEVACRSGTGYFLVSQPPQESLAVSCFAADARHVADLAKGAKPDEFTCTLSGYKDAKTMAAAVLKRAGTICDVNDYRWVGVSSVNGTEYSEVACADGQGYIFALPKIGPTAQVSVVGCPEALKEGVKCNLTAVTMPVTLQTLRDAIRDHAVDCAPTQIRYVGRETQGRRYVVELQCPQQPKGLVAFIPLEGNPKPFETLDCSAAVARAVHCTLTAKQ